MLIQIASPMALELHPVHHEKPLLADQVARIKSERARLGAQNERLAGA